MPMPMPTPISTDTAVAERRRSTRRAVSEVVRLELHDDVPGSFPALLVTDISDGGVRLYAQNVDVPAQFVLVFADSGVRRECRRVWRIGDEAGVEFVDSPPPTGQTNGRRLGL